MEEKYKNRLIEIDDRIKDLNAHMSMWSRAGSGKMAMQATTELELLKAERERILDGTQVRVDEIQNKINELKELRTQCKIISFIKKHNLNKQIKGYETEKSNIFKR